MTKEQISTVAKAQAIKRLGEKEQLGLFDESIKENLIKQIEDNIEKEKLVLHLSYSQLDYSNFLKVN